MASQGGEQYEGVKFETRFSSRAIPYDARCQVLIDWSRVFARRGLSTAKGGAGSGNLSFRHRPAHSSFVITGSGTVFDYSLTGMRLALVSAVDQERRRVTAQGVVDPSSESMLHWALYQARPDVRAVFHGHSTDVLERADAMGVAITETEEPYGTLALVHQVLALAGSNDVLIMRGHGFICLGRTLDEAGRSALALLANINRRS